ncbi:hypothetical protein G9A89_023978 [Geosiphon pyriformis]|nr:hypothetical protein G9A89_023978 [Geosiphon pyriformis]
MLNILEAQQHANKDLLNEIETLKKQLVNKERKVKSEWQSTLTKPENEPKVKVILIYPKNYTQHGLNTFQDEVNEKEYEEKIAKLEEFNKSLDRDRRDAWKAEDTHVELANDIVKMAKEQNEAQIKDDALRLLAKAKQIIQEQEALLNLHEKPLPSLPKKQNKFKLLGTKIKNKFSQLAEKLDNMRELLYTILDLDENKAVCQIRTRNKASHKIVDSACACGECKEKFENDEILKCEKCGELKTRMSFHDNCLENDEKELPILPHEERASTRYERQINSLQEQLNGAE